MTKAQFDAIYDITIQEIHQPIYRLRVSVIERATGKVVYVVNAGGPDNNPNEIAGDSQHAINPMDADYIKDQFRRYALDIIAKVFGITDWFPINNETPINY